jgi:hypothetical protein
MTHEQNHLGGGQSWFALQANKDTLQRLNIGIRANTPILEQRIAENASIP